MKKWLLLALMLPLFGMAQENLWPDREFDATGVKTEAHSGEKAGMFGVTAQTRWTSYNGRKLKIEPYAVYRATAWAKCEAGSNGRVCALYTYGWYSFGWNFMFSTTLQPDGEWHKVTVDFYGPDETYTFIPLVIEGSSKAKAWIDELEIVKVKSAEEHIAELRKIARPANYEARLLARYYLRKGDFAALKKLAAVTDGISRGDIDCLIIQNKLDEANNLSYISDMICGGGINTPDGPKRLNEFMAPLTMLQRVQVLVDAFRKGENEASCRRAWELTIPSFDISGRLRRAELTDKLVELDMANKLVTAADNEKKIPEDLAKSWYRKGMQILMAVEQKRVNIGRRVIKIDGVALRSDTHVIVIPEEATPSEAFAAEELAYYLEEMTGQLFDIVTDKADVQKYPIFLGRSRLLEKYGFSVDYKKLGLEGIHVESNPRNHALLLGGGQRGVLYSVYTLLDDYLGCRWFTADCSFIPKAAETVELNNLKNVFVPYLEQRDANYTCNYPPEFGVRNKMNGAAVRADAKWGSHVIYCGFVHTFNSLVPPAIYGAEHPEYYSEIKGKRVVERSQLCLTNPDVLRIATAEIRKRIQEHPEAMIFSVSQNDWRNYCTCEKCTKLAEYEGSQAGPLVHFVNAIANDIAKDYPDKIIDTLAYQYTRKPPKHVKPAPNVAIRLCSIECCFIHPLDECPTNKSFVDDIKGWAAICNRLHIWDYVINYAHNNMPFPNFRVLAPNIEFFIRNHVTSIFEEANYYSDAGELAELRAYVMAKLLWEPKYDVAKAIREFTDGYYGAAAPFIREYLTMLHDNVCNKKDLHVRIYASAQQYLNDKAMMDKSTELFMQAMDAVKDNPDQLFRVQVAYLPIIYAKQMLASSAFYLKDGMLIGSLSSMSELDFFERVAKKANLSRTSENARWTTANWLAARRSAANKYPIVTLKSDALSLDILPTLGGRIWRAQLADGCDILRVNGDGKDGYHPDVDGYEEYATPELRGLGWNEKYTVKAQGKDFVEMECLLKDGVLVTRRIELSGNSFKVSSKYTSKTVKGNRSFRVHPVFNVPEPLNATLIRTLADGKKDSVVLGSRMADDVDYLEIWGKDADKPLGHWQLSFKTADKRTCTVTNTFDPAGVDFCYMYMNTTNKHVNLEQWSAAKELSPTDGPAITNTYTIDVK